MHTTEDYLNINKDAWDKRTSVHVDSEFYNMPRFLQGATSLNDTELSLLGDISGKSILHLQCHFGQDTLSLARMGAKVTGVDFSTVAIDKAKALNQELQLDAKFICCSVYDLPAHLNQQFDIVFTSYGTIGWLPDLNKWGEILQNYLKPGGTFVMVDFHPVIWMFDAKFSHMIYSYFNTGPILEQSEGSYTDKNAPIQYQEVGWNHSLEEIFSALLQHKLTITNFKEFNYSNYNCFQDMIAIENNKYRIKAFGDKAPLMYALVAEKK